MKMDIKIFSIAVSVVILLLIFELARREKINFKYSISWILLASLAIFFEIFDGLLYRIAGWFGFTLTSNFVFFVLMTFFVCISLFLTIFLCRQNRRNDIMAQKIGMLELELKQLKEKLSVKG